MPRQPHGFPQQPVHLSCTYRVLTPLSGSTHVRCRLRGSSCRPYPTEPLSERWYDDLHRSVDPDAAVRCLPNKARVAV